MKFIQTCLLAASASIALAAPVSKRATIDDGEILNFALTLEFLEAQFYKDALANFTDQDFASAGFTGIRDDIVLIGQHEQAHADFLNATLFAAGIPAVQPCNYSFPVTNVVNFLALAQIIEGVGVSAYLGAASAIENKDLLTAAASILPIEARHNTFLIGTNAGNPIPYYFDTPLGMNEVFTLASSFIVSCPADNPTLPVKAFPGLNVNNTMVTSNQTVTIEGPATNGTGNGTFAVVISGLDTFPVPVDENNEFTFPSDPTIQGQVYLVLSQNGTVSDDQVIAGPAILMANGGNSTQG